MIGVGGLGHIAIQLLHEMTPARVAAIDPASQGRELAQSTGAAKVLDPADAADAVAELRAACLSLRRAERARFRRRRRRSDVGAG